MDVFAPRQKLTRTYGRARHVFFPALKFSVDAAAPLYSQEITALRVKVKEPRSEEECESIFQVDISQKQQQEKKKKSCSEDKANKAGGCNHLEANKKREKKRERSGVASPRAATLR